MVSYVLVPGQEDYLANENNIDTKLDISEERRQRSSGGGRDKSEWNRVEKKLINWG